jgi:hypothetical protein
LTSTQPAAFASGLDLISSGELLGLKSLGRIANPLDADRYKALFRAARARHRIDAGADQRECRLIIMVMRRLNDGNVSTRRPALENGRNGYAGSTTADDENLMVY